MGEKFKDLKVQGFRSSKKLGSKGKGVKKYRVAEPLWLGGL